MKGQFEKYVNTIRKSAHYYSSVWDIDYEEVESQGFLIYCECIKTFDLSKSGFGTYLTWQLKRLNDFCRTYKRQQGLLIEDKFKAPLGHENDFVCDNIPEKSENVSFSELLEIGIANLSKDAYKIFKWILERSWEQKGRQKPSITLAMKTFNFTRIETERLWIEIGNFYNQIVIGL